MISYFPKVCLFGKKSPDLTDSIIDEFFILSGIRSGNVSFMDQSKAYRLVLHKGFVVIVG